MVLHHSCPLLLGHINELWKGAKRWEAFKAVRKIKMGVRRARRGGEIRGAT